jgi:hypothetical protein
MLIAPVALKACSAEQIKGLAKFRERREKAGIKNDKHDDYRG